MRYVAPPGVVAVGVDGVSEQRLLRRQPVLVQLLGRKLPAVRRAVWTTSSKRFIEIWRNVAKASSSRPASRSSRHGAGRPQLRGDA